MTGILLKVEIIYDFSVFDFFSFKLNIFLEIWYQKCEESPLICSLMMIVVIHVKKFVKHTERKVGLLPIKI